MKKSLRILTVLSVVASSFLFATPSHAVSVNSVDITVGGGTTIASSTSNRVILSGTSTSASDYVEIDLGGGISFRIANMNENNGFYNPRPTIGIPSSAESGYDKTFNIGLGQGYNAKADIYVNGSLNTQALCPSGNFTAPAICSGQKTNRAFTPFVQFNYSASSGIISARVPVTSGSGTTITINSDGTYTLFSGTVTSWVAAGSIAVAPSITVSSTPTSVVATATGKRSATVSFEAPTTNGGSAITSYTAISTPGAITKTLTQATGGTFNFDGLQPGTAYTFAVTATNAIGTSAAATSNSATTTPLVVASLSALSFVDDGTGTGGKIVWAGQNIDAVLYTGPANSYPGPYNYGAFTGGWNGRIRNLTPNTEYTISIYAISADGVGESKSLTFKTSATLPELVGAASSTAVQTSETKLSQMINWVNENTFNPGEAANMTKLLTKFMAIETSPHRSFVRVPTSRVSKVVATSLTPNSCRVENQGIVTALSADTCTISYTVTGGSKAPATMVKEFKFTKFVG